MRPWAPPEFEKKMINKGFDPFELILHEPKE